VVARGFFGDGQHLLVDVACTTVWGNSDFCANRTIPGNAALDREKNKFTADEKSSRPVSKFFGGDHVLIPFVMEDGGRLGDQGQALLLLLAERAVASGYIKTPPSWNTLGTAALVSLSVRRWQQRLSAWLHVKTARLLLRQSSPVGIYL